MASIRLKIEVNMMCLHPMTGGESSGLADENEVESAFVLCE